MPPPRRRTSRSASQRILGLDPGLTATGYAVIDADNPKAKPIAVGDIRTKARDPLGKRLQAIHDGVAALVERHRPASVSVEALFARINVKTALLMAQARGVAILAATSEGAELAEYAPAEIKKLIAGSGRAGKEQISAVVRALVPLGRRKLSDHATDALAAALCHSRHLGFTRATGEAPTRRTGSKSRRRQWTDFVESRDK